MHKRSFPTVLDDSMGAQQGEMLRHGRSIASYQINELSHRALPTAKAVHNFQPGFVGECFKYLGLLREYVALRHRSHRMAEWPYMQVRK